MTNNHAYLLGLDIGGTKCAAVLGMRQPGRQPRVLDVQRLATVDYPEPKDCVQRLCGMLQDMMAARKIEKDSVAGVGISCGGPLNARLGLVQSPPNLPGWDNVPVCRCVEEMLELPAVLENDANACALAEWKYGAGERCGNMVFLTFGTGMGAGIIANGALIGGSCGMAGECGHIRLAEDGPLGYG